MNKTRLEAFSDGVIAIIITIMVLEMRAPERGTWEALQQLAPELLSYVMSFVFVGIYWGNHHHLVHVVKKVSTGIIWSNLNLLFWLSLVPFATGWMGKHSFEPFPVAVYALLLNICGLSYYILQMVIDRCHELSPAMKRAIDKQKRKGMISLLAYSSSIPLAFVHTAISVTIFIAVAIMWLVPDKNIERAAEETH